MGCVITVNMVGTEGLEACYLKVISLGMVTLNAFANLFIVMRLGQVGFRASRY